MNPEFLQVLRNLYDAYCEAMHDTWDTPFNAWSPDADSVAYAARCLIAAAVSDQEKK